MNNNEDHLPQSTIQEYRNSPVIDKSLEEQVVYWKRRAKFFENKAYEFYKYLQGLEDQDDSDWWKRE